MKRITLLLLVCIAVCANAQIVETMNTTEPTSCDDLFVDKSGIIYTGKGGLSNKTDLGKIMPDGTTTSVAQGMKGPISIVEAPNGLLYVTNYDDNSIKSYDPTNETVITVATGLDGPAGITVDSAGVIYASNWGGAPAYNGHQIHRLMPDGTLEVFKDSPLFSRLQGIAIDDEGWLYTANTQNGRIFKINTTTGAMETLVTLGKNVVNMEFHEGHFYMASIQSNKIFKMGLDGSWSTFAGTGVSGGQDGPAESATFNNPIGVGFSPTGDTLYVSDSPQRIRRIIIDEVSSTLPFPDLSGLNISVFPNPSPDRFEIELDNQPITGAEYQVVDVMGRVALSGKINNRAFSIDLSDEREGYYFLVLHYKGFTRSAKLSVKR